jgi:glycosyltransferase involved in cell wall biosynthesis
MKATKILLISGFRIFPTSTGGHIRTASITRALARMGYEVKIYSLAGRQGDYSLGHVMPNSYRLDQIEPNLVEETHLGLGYGLLQTIGRRRDVPRTWQHSLMSKGWVPLRLKEALREADIILSDMPWCPQIPGPWLAKPWFLVSHNLEYRLLEQSTGAYKDAAAWMKQLEESAPAQFTDILACAEEDQKFFRTHDRSGQKKIPILRGGVDPKAYIAPTGSRERVRAELGLTEQDTLLVFSGSKFAPNLEAFETVKQFCVREAPFLTHERVRILALGSMSDRAYREGALIVTGRVPEVLPYFAAADAGLNPITTGSGANVKLFEYLAARLPIISTQFGVRGTTLQPDIDFIAYTPDTFKQAIERFVRMRNRAEWRVHAEAVWMRHRKSCDIEELVKDSLAQLPQFALASA